MATVAGVRSERAADGNRLHHFGEERALQWRQASPDLVSSSTIHNWECRLGEDRSGVDALVDSMDGHAVDSHAMLHCSLYSVTPWEGRQQGGVDVDDPVRECLEKVRSE